MRKILTVVAAVTLLAGCGATGQAPGSEVTVTETVTVTATPEEMDVVEGEPAEEELTEVVEDAPAPAAGMLSFGDRAELDGIMAVTVGVPRSLDMDPEAWDFEDFDTYLAVPITVENIGAEPVSTGDLMVQMLSGERAAETFIWSSGGVSGDPYATVLPGKTVTFTNGYAVGAGEELVVEVKQMIGDDAAYYEG